MGVLRPTQRQLVLAVLALRAGTAVPPGKLVDARWEQAPASAVSTVHKHVRAPSAVLEPGHGGQARSPGTVKSHAHRGLRELPGGVFTLPAISETATSSSNTQ